jgi:FKBP-type peptidyl-prolyl cis-trans isomerase FkpA
MKPTRLIVLSILLTAAACSDSPNEPTPTPRAEYSQTDIRVGTGTEATSGKTVTANYGGWLYDPNGADGKGAQFDSSTRSGPITFVLGGNGVISGFNRGVQGMRVGGLRRFVLPPELAYGSTGNGPIPPNTTIVFEVELTNVQ